MSVFLIGKHNSFLVSAEDEHGEVSALLGSESGNLADQTHEKDDGSTGSSGVHASRVLTMPNRLMIPSDPTENCFSIQINYLLAFYRQSLSFQTHSKHLVGVDNFSLNFMFSFYPSVHDFVDPCVCQLRHQWLVKSIHNL